MGIIKADITKAVFYIKTKGFLCKSSKKNQKELLVKSEDVRYNR